MRKMLGLGLVLALAFGMTGSTMARSFAPPPDRRAGDQLKKIYSVLSIGMDMNDVWGYIRVGYPNGKVQNMDLDQTFSDVFRSNPENDLLVVFIGEGGIHTKFAYFPQVSLVLTFEKKHFTLSNALYIRYKNARDGETNEKPLECSVLVEDLHNYCRHE